MAAVVLPRSRDVSRTQHLGGGAVLEPDAAHREAFGDEEADAASGAELVGLRRPGAFAQDLQPRDQVRPAALRLASTRPSPRSGSMSDNGRRPSVGAPC